MILVYDMSGSERLDAVPGEAMVEPMVESGPSERGVPLMDEPCVAPALQEVVSERPAEAPLPPAAVIDVERLLQRMA